MLGEGLAAGLRHLGVYSRCILYAEREAYPCAVLEARMEEGSLAAAPIWCGDFTELRVEQFRGVVDCVVAGFPCQDLSVAGKRAGLDGQRSGLFFEVVRIAADSARFGAPIARLGFPMAPREAALVAQAAGSTVARAMLLAAEVFDAPAMLGHGFLTRVCMAAELGSAGHELAVRIAGLAPQAARLNKQTLRRLNEPVAPAEYAHIAPDLIASELRSPYAYADSAEHREGIAAFLDKRKPVF